MNTAGPGELPLRTSSWFGSVSSTLVVARHALPGAGM